MSSNMKKWLSRITPLAVAFVMCVCVGALCSSVYAADGDPDLVVSYDGTSVAFFLDNDTESPNNGQIYCMAGEDRVYVTNTTIPKFTSVKNTGSTSDVKNAKGPRVEDIFAAAGFDSISNDSEITFTSNDNKTSKFMWSELIGTTRYAFPNYGPYEYSTDPDPKSGGFAVTPEDKEGSSEVYAMINISKSQMCFGQVSPSERNRPGFVSGMLGTKPDGTPTITVQSGATFGKVSNPAESPTLKGYGGNIPTGTEIDFNIPEDDEALDNLGTIYYTFTTDGSEPDEPTKESAMYNWFSYNGIIKCNSLVATETGILKVKARAFKYDNQPSDIVEFTYNVNPALSVSYDGTSVAFFLDNDTESPNNGQIYCMAGENRVYVPNTTISKFTSVKNTGSTSDVKNAKGPKVEDIFAAAGFNSIANDSEITFASNDNKTSKFMWSELIGTTRYAFPNYGPYDYSTDPDPESGGFAVTPEDKEGSSEVYAMINISKSQMCFGQVSPSERNRPGFVSGMLGTTADGTPTITVRSGATFGKVSNPAEGPEIESYKGVVVAGTKVDFSIPKDEEGLDNLGTIYYTFTTDGSEPDEPTKESAMYNWFSYNGIIKCKSPVVAGDTFKVKAKAFKYGMQASDTVTFTYAVVPEDFTNNAVVTLSKTASAIGTKPGVQAVKINGKTVSSKYYTVSYSGISNIGIGKASVKAKKPFTGEVSKTFSVTADLTKNKGAVTLNKTKVIAGVKPYVKKVTINNGTQTVTVDKQYYTTTVPSTKKVGKYKVTVKGKNLLSGTLTKAFTVVPAKAKFKSVKAGKKKATIVIVSQKTSGVTKYQIKYKKASAKSWKSTTTTSTKKVIKKLKKGKKYNFKVRAYGKTGYGAFSTVKTIKIK